MTFLDYSSMVAYLIGMVAIGLWFSRDKQDTENYLLGNRSMAWWLLGVSYMISLMSTITLVAIPGEAYNNGLTMVISILLMPLTAVATFFIFIRFYFKSRVFTPFQYLEQRFDHRVRAVGAAIYWLTRLMYLALVLYSSAKVFQGASGWPIPLTIILVGVVGIAYTTVGGFRAVVWTDLVQFLVLAVGIFLILAVAIRAVPDGLIGAFQFAFENNRGFEAAKDPSFLSFDPHVRLTLWLLLFGSLTSSLFGNSADQIAIQRLIATKGYAEAKRTLYMSVSLAVPVVLMLWMIGVAIFSFYGHQPEELRPESGDLALFQFIGSHLPSPIPGLIVAAMLAAVMSTLDSGMNSLATVATKDFYLRHWRKDADEASQIRFAKSMTTGVGLFAIVVGLILGTLSSGIGETIIEAGAVWTTLGAVLAPAFLLGVTSKRLNATGVLIAMGAGWVGTALTVIWYYFSRWSDNHEPISFLYTGVPGLVLTLLVGYLLARFTPQQPEEKISDLTLFTLQDGKSANSATDSSQQTDRAELPGTETAR